ncbi:hypothetical protein DHEL01_v204642 [Diaporthe helianthi]|uniref:Uncharacterized protein n=1 Tax=Diaporthe helianthi TaxID=158607 RepID=A0A2P5I397_DIAHE|nr:hypothetical protein DHEL01_v204642 [Diaporthe helianthi]
MIGSTLAEREPIVPRLALQEAWTGTSSELCFWKNWYGDMAAAPGPRCPPLLTKPLDWTTGRLVVDPGTRSCSLQQRRSLPGVVDLPLHVEPAPTGVSMPNPMVAAGGAGADALLSKFRDPNSVFVFTATASRDRLEEREH